MFLVFVNELAEILERACVKIKFFADDVKVCVQIISKRDVYKLRNALNVLGSWA